MFKDQDKDKDLSSKDKDKDCIVKDKDQDKDCILVLKESLRTRTRTNITAVKQTNAGKNITSVNMTAALLCPR